ncbi:MAG: hypothetical protein LJE91_15740 [Gammaproteobacteria bacterium]|jgi:hypothetical protein|nr:hypothetical protein [Gammaproteobacteria bacterium]
MEQALELLSGLPKHKERMRLEADPHAMLAPATIATQGWKAPQAEASYLRASELYERLGDEASRFSVRYGVDVLHEIRGEYPKTQSVLEDCLSRLRDHRQSGVIEAHELLACSLYHQGAFVNSVQHADQGFGAYRILPLRFRARG